MLCDACHKESEEGLIFCPHCGNRLPESKTQAPQAEPLQVKPLPVEHLQEGVTNAKLQIDYLSNEVEKRKKTTGFLTVAVVILFIVSIGLIVALTNSNDQLNKMEFQLSDYRSMLSSILPDGMMVKVTSVYNSDEHGEKIGDTLSSSSIKFLSFDYEIFTRDGIDDFLHEDLDVKIYNPDGSMMHGSDESSSQTFTQEIKGSYGSSGWGSTTGLAYYKGFYLIQFVYDEKIVGSEAVYIQ